MILHSPFYDSAHEAFRDQVRRFVRTEIEPHVDEWDEAGTFPRELYRKAAQVGLLQLNYPEELGGVPADGSIRSSSARSWRAAVRAECARL
jgi:acyl-CoA dehydrogenase